MTNCLQRTRQDLGQVTDNPEVIVLYGREVCSVQIAEMMMVHGLKRVGLGKEPSFPTTMQVLQWGVVLPRDESWVKGED